MDPLTVGFALGKLVLSGMSLNLALGNETFDEADMSALKSLVDDGGGVFGLWKKREDTRPAALHMAITSLCFGAAVARHWAGSTTMVPNKTRLPEALAKWWNKEEHTRRKEIEMRTRYAELHLRKPGESEVGASELALLAGVTGSPLHNPVYQALWKAFSDPALATPMEDAPLLLNEGDAREFERHYRLAWVEAVATPQGQQVQSWRLGLSEERTQTVLQLLAEDLAAWGRRHVFGNARTQSKGDPIPFMALDDMYVEPMGELTIEGEPKSENAPVPILGLIRGLLSKHQLVVVKADFGHGKSLTARRLARDLAREWLNTMQPSVAAPYPVFVKCVRDILGEYNHEMALRRALRATAHDAVGQVESQDSDLYRLPSGQNTWLLLDGLDEIAFQPIHLREMFGLLEGHTGDACRAIVFTRPGALHGGSVPKGTPVVELQSFGSVQIEDWLTRWNSLPQEPALDLNSLKNVEVAELAQVPILLLMIALTWNEHGASKGKLDQARLYEHFFQHIAHGKHQGDTDEHLHIREASERLLQRMQRDGLQALGDHATGVDAMLWLMSRTAWEAHRLNYAQPPQELQRRHVDALVVDELGMPASDAVLIKIGLLLALQFDPSGDGTTLLFGHQSFREFLVARYWNHQLRQLARRKQGRRDVEQMLMLSRLYQPQDKAFGFLREMLADVKGSERERLVEWAEDTFNDESLSTGNGGRFRDDRRSPLRESALAIGSELSDGFVLDRDALVSLWAWFEVQGRAFWIWAPRAKCTGDNLSEIHLERANLSGARLPGVNLSSTSLEDADLNGADLRSSHLEFARLMGVRLDSANLEQANLTGASLMHAVLVGCNLRAAGLQRAYLYAANFSGANLEDADLTYARLAGANFSAANLKGANLGKANADYGSVEKVLLKFNGANLEKANLSAANLARADFAGATLKGSNLANANLMSANLVDADLQDAVLDQTKLTGARYNSASRLPSSLDTVREGMIDVGDEGPNGARQNGEPGSTTAVVG